MALVPAAGSLTFSVTLAAFATAVAHHAHAPEVLVTVPYAGREDEGHESLIGLFANNLMLRILVDRGATFEALVHRTQDVLLDALDHASTPFHHVEERLRADRISIAAQLVIQVYPRSMCDATLREPNDVAFHLLGFRTAAQHRELGLYLVKPDEGPLNGWLTHQTAVTNPGEAVGILGSFSRLLLTALRMPDRPVEVLLQHAQRHPDDDGIYEAVPWEGDCWVTGESHFPIHLLRM